MKKSPRASWRYDQSYRQHPQQVAFVQSILQSPTPLPHPESPSAQWTAQIPYSYDPFTTSQF